VPPASDRSRGISPVVATILLVALTLILALMVLLLFSLPSWDVGDPPAIFVITTIDHHSDLAPYRFNYDSRVTIVNTGAKSYENRLLKALFYRNQVQMNAVITTLDGHDFISSRHFGVQWMGGSGCSGGTWTPGESTVIDFTDGTFRPGDLVQLDIVDTISNRTISRHRYTA
jgi:flagellin-like protein